VSPEIDVLVDMFAPFKEALRPGLRTARADGHPQPLATTSDQRHRTRRHLLVYWLGRDSCRHPQAQFTAGRVHMGFGHLAVALRVRQLFSLVTQTLGR
jgi:hypothetical protein